MSRRKAFIRAAPEYLESVREAPGEKVDLASMKTRKVHDHFDAGPAMARSASARSCPAKMKTWLIKIFSLFYHEKNGPVYTEPEKGRAALRFMSEGGRIEAVAALWSSTQRHLAKLQRIKQNAAREFKECDWRYASLFAQ